MSDERAELTRREALKGAAAVTAAAALAPLGALCATFSRPNRPGTGAPGSSPPGFAA